jgi:hypothetical protein
MLLAASAVEPPFVARGILARHPEKATIFEKRWLSVGS